MALRAHSCNRRLLVYAVLFIEMGAFVALLGGVVSLVTRAIKTAVRGWGTDRKGPVSMQGHLSTNLLNHEANSERRSDLHG